ncbi:MAG: biopolymer transporter ExbD [Polyangiaceae bacterium]
MASENPSSGLAPAQRAKIRRLSAPREGEPGEEGGELNVVPYLDIIMNVMMFMLAAVSVVFVSTVTTQAAAVPRGFADPPPVLRLTALVTNDGIALIAGGSHIAPGCEGAGAGVTIPKTNGAYDLSALTECARKIKGSHKEYEDETTVTLSANPDVAYQDVVGVMDALRSDAAGALFPTVTLGVVR